MWERNDNYKNQKCTISTIDQQSYNNTETTNGTTKYTNCGRDNHNINTSRGKKKEESIVATTKATTHNQKVQKTISKWLYNIRAI
jgi:hypothetical protein